MFGWFKKKPNFAVYKTLKGEFFIKNEGTGGFLDGLDLLEGSPNPFEWRTFGTSCVIESKDEALVWCQALNNKAFPPKQKVLTEKEAEKIYP